MIQASTPNRSQESPNRLLLARSARTLPRQSTETKCLSVLAEPPQCSLSGAAKGVSACHRTAADQIASLTSPAGYAIFKLLAVLRLPSWIALRVQRMRGYSAVFFVYYFSGEFGGNVFSKSGASCAQVVRGRCFGSNPRPFGLARGATADGERQSEVHPFSRYGRSRHRGECRASEDHRNEGRTEGL